MVIVRDILHKKPLPAVPVSRLRCATFTHIYTDTATHVERGSIHRHGVRGGREWYEIQRTAIGRADHEWNNVAIDVSLRPDAELSSWRCHQAKYVVKERKSIEVMEENDSPCEWEQDK